MKKIIISFEYKNEFKWETLKTDQGNAFIDNLIKKILILKGEEKAK